MEFLSESRIKERFDRLRIDQYLARCYCYLSRSEWQREISNGKIFYNGSVLFRHDKKVKPGDSIFYTGRDAATEPAVDANYSIVYEDDWLLGIDKPGNLPVHPAGVFYHNTLLTFLQNRFQRKLHLVHRLDRETSGVVVLAKDARTASWFQKNFSSVQKAYLALVHGRFPSAELIVDIPLGPDPASGFGHKRAAFAGAKDAAKTMFRSISCFSGYSLVKAVPYTGRQHQIRAHLKYAGYPVAGDRLYGAVDGLYEEFIKKGVTEEMRKKMSFHRSALHSRSMQFYHPALNKTMCIRAPLPEDMRGFINQRRTTDV